MAAGALRVGLTALLAAATALAVLEGCASAPGVVGRMPGTEVTGGFRAPEAVGRWGSVDVTVGRSRPAYLYTPDHRFALVADGPEREATDLNPQAGSWEITCVTAGASARCRLVAVGTEKLGGVRQVALVVDYDPAGRGTTVCVGPPHTRGAALRVGEHGVWREADADGCFSPEASAPLLAALRADSQLGYRYQGTAEGRISGWRPAYGLPEALDLMRWLYGRVASA